MYFSSDNPDPSGPQNQVVTGEKVKKKKRRITDLDIMYLGGSNVEEAPKRKRYKQNSEIQETASAPLTGDTYAEEQADQETSTKKKKKKGESHREADDITADDTSCSVVHHVEHNRKKKKSKNSKKLHGDKGFAEEAPYSELTDLEGRSKKEKKKSKKDRSERDVDVSLVEESLTADTHHGKKKKNKRKDGGALQENGFSEELFSQRKSTDGSETPQQVEESVDQSEKTVKKKKRDRSHQEADGITTNDASSSVGLQGDKPSHSELAEDRTIWKKKNKTKKDHKERLVEDNLVEESLATEAQHTSRKKTKRKDGGDETYRQHGLTEVLVIKRKHQGGSETPEKVDENVDQLEKPAKKKKKRKDRSHQEADDITADDASSSIGLHGDKPSHSELTDTEDMPSRKKKKKSKKDHGDHLLGDNLVEESLATDAQHTSRKKTKRKDGGDEGQRQPGLTEELVTKRKHQGGSETPEQVDTGEDQTENSLVEELLIPENQHAKKKKKKQKHEGDVQEDGLTEELVTKRKHQGGAETPEQVDESVDTSEKPVKKKKRKNISYQEADDITADDASSSVGPQGDKPSHSELTDTEDRTIRKKKKKAKKDHGERLLEHSQVGKSLTPGAQHRGEKTKQKDGGDESYGFTETTEQVADTVDRAEVPAKKKMAKKKHLGRKEDTREMSSEDDVPMDSTMMNRSLQSRAVGGDAHKDTEETSTSSGPQTSASTDTDQNPATQDGPETVQNEGNNRPTTTAQNREKQAAKFTSYLNSMREKDLALLEEFLPNFKTLRTVSKLQIVNYDMDRIRAAKRAGIRFLTGKFTIEEDELLKKNVEKFLLDVGLDSAEVLFHPYKFPDQIKTIRQLKTKYNFRLRIADGLHRLSSCVFERGFTLYECPRTRGRYTQEEVKLLKKCSEKYKNRWSLASTVLNRSCASLASKAADVRQDMNSGKWSLEEINCLIAVMKEFILMTLREEGHSMKEPVMVPKEKLYKGVRWVWVEERVKTRSHYQCTEKWLSIVILRMNNHVNPLQGALGIKNSIEIIKWLHETNVRDPRDVQWEKLSDHLGNIPIRSAQNIFQKWRRRIPGFSKMRLYEIVDDLYNNTLPYLEAKMSVLECPEEPERRSSFLISEIFYESIDGV